MDVFTPPQYTIHMRAVGLILFAFGLTLASATGTGRCCDVCPSGKQMYYSIPKQGGGLQCGQACLEPSRYPEWKLFEPALTPGSCASQGFTHYTETATDGVCPLCVTNDRYTQSGASDALVAEASNQSDSHGTSAATVAGYACGAALFVAAAALVAARRRRWLAGGASRGKHAAGTPSASCSDEAGASGVNPGVPAPVDDDLNAL